MTINNKDLQTINQGIQKIAAEYDLIFVNLYPHFTDKNGDLDRKYTADGIHLNGNGYKIWKEQIEQFLLKE